MPSAVAPTPPRFEHRTDGGPCLGLGVRCPRLSWVVPSAETGYVQRAYELELTRHGSIETIVVESDQQVLVDWPFTPLTSREAVSVRVRVRDDEWSAWSDRSAAEVGLLATEDWTAGFITPVSIGGLDQPAPVLATTVELPDDIASARLYASAHGVYVPFVNGERVSDQHFAPGWSAYESRLRYQTYDVTAHVRAGRNTLSVLLGNGWFRGYLGYLGGRAIYGDELALIAQLEVTRANGEIIVIATDESWRATESEIILDDFYNGQTTDLRLRGRAQEPTAVRLADVDLARLVAPDGPPVRAVATLPAEKVWTAPSGETLVDFGQNAVGWVRLRVRDLPPGAEVVIRHAEVLEHEELGTRPLRAARATDRYIVAGGGEEVLEPTLTFHGFRYAEITGVRDLKREDLELVVLSSDLPRVGWFDSSDPQLNRLHENVVWGMRGNFLDVPTDCPQRDERLGWTGDIQVFSPTATFLHDVSGFLESWLKDLSAEQLPDGRVPHIIPDPFKTSESTWPGAAWGDAATVVPWVLYERTGDRGILHRQFDSMRAWVDLLRARAGDDLLWTGDRQFGDWLDPTAPPEEPAGAAADPDVIATAHFARSASLVARAAEVIGRTEEAFAYSSLAEAIREAFVGAYVSPRGLITSDAQTVYALAIQWHLLPDAATRAAAGDRLNELVRAADYRIATGFVGTPLVCDALTATGHAETAHRMLFQDQCPSWLYSVSMGATTIWERWDSMLPDGSINPGEMTSFNHYALGAVADWMHRSVAGLAPAAPGYREITVRPILPTRLDHASARHVTPYGEVAVSWGRRDDAVDVKVTVPVGCSATVELPDGSPAIRVGHGEHQWSVAAGGQGTRGFLTAADPRRPCANTSLASDPRRARS